jgi:lipopolysaccharide export system permease protein
MFVLLMLFLFKYIDDLIGKGFEWYIIAELLWYASATYVPMALPLSVLLSSIMTFGSLGENYELVAIKSAGISLQKAMTPLIILISLLGTGAFLFSDYMLPVANLKMLSLLYDVRNQKADFMIEEGIFNNSIPGYAIKVQKKDPDGQTLRGVLIYDQVSNAGSMTVLMAKEGVKYLSNDKQFLVLKLKDGIRYQETAGKQGGASKRQVFMRYRFKETEQTFDLSAFKFQRTDENLFKSNYQMLNLRQLSYYRDSVQLRADSNTRSEFVKLKGQYKYFLKLPKDQKISGKPADYVKVTDMFRPYDRRNAVYNANERTRQLIEMLKVSATQSELYMEPVRKVIIEYQRKFTLSVACLLLFSIGAPLGAIIRKGGLGMPVVMSILFFLVYHIISTIAEKAAQEGTIPTVAGMWTAIVVLTPVGIFLTYKATADSTLFNIDYYKQLIQKLFVRKKA